MENISPALLYWFHANHRILPFRSDPTPYHVWLSEIMLQQTRVSAALPYYERFLAALPDIPALAACEEEKLHKLWEGLGYYSRVRNLQKAAKLVCAQYGGELPADYDALRALPGIGDYTAGAIASISFGLPVPAVDGNVLRVFSPPVQRRPPHHRPQGQAGIHGPCHGTPAPGCPRRLQSGPDGAGCAGLRTQRCPALCAVPAGPPLRRPCRRDGPHPAPQSGPKARRIEPVTLALVRSPEGVLLQQRPEKGLLAGLWQPVLWEDESLSADEARARLAALGVVCTPDAAKALRPARHIFSHIEWHMGGYLFTAERQPAPVGCVWASPEQLEAAYTLPGAFKAYRKLLAAAF